MEPLAGRGPEGESVTIEPGAVEELRSSLRGELLLPGAGAYEEARSIWNGMIDRRPAMIARCLGVGDVKAGVEFAASHGIALSIKGGGHNIAGLAVAEGGLMLDMSAMRGVWVDPKGRTAHAQAGCLLGDVDRETQLHGLAAVLGFVSKTGIAGLTVGGGFGYTARKYGWTCDNVRSMQVVTAQGEIERASAEENADLFWGLRGGGGNFGVVTDFEYDLHPLGPEILGGAMFWKAREAREVLEAYRSLMREAPRELNCVAVLRNAPPTPALPEEMHGEPIIAVFVCHIGEIEEGESLIAPLREVGTLVGDVVQRRPYLVQQSLLDATQPDGRRYYWKSDYLPGIEDGLLDKVVEYADRVPSPHSAVILFPVDGALNELPAGHSPMGNRDAEAVLNITAAWDAPEEDDANIGWARRAWEEMRPFSTGGTYINFQTEEEGEDRLRAAYGDNFDRLRDVKTKWDPDNLFRLNKNIPPK